MECYIYCSIWEETAASGQTSLAGKRRAKHKRKGRDVYEMLNLQYSTVQCTLALELRNRRYSRDGW